MTHVAGSRHISLDRIAQTVIAPREPNADEPPTSGLNEARLAALLRAIAHENRIKLLSLLRSPRAIQDIRLRPSPQRAGARPERPLSRQSVQQHVDLLVEAGIVRSVVASSSSGALHEYVADHARLFGVVEELRTITKLPPQARYDPNETLLSPQPQGDEWSEGPKLVLVHGVQEGRVFQLRQTELSRDRGWVIGRRPGSHVQLLHDPYVSVENSEIMRVKSGFEVLDLRTARNGTHVNWNRLPTGGTAPLETGDVIGVGRSLLVFREQ